MLMAMIRLLRRSLGLLLCLAPGFSVAQSNEDSTFNAVDYYSGRIASGFGGGYEQTWLKDDEGNQRFMTTPSLYGSVSTRVGIQISHEISWPRESTIIDSIPDGVRKVNPAKAKTSRIQLQFRPMRELQIFFSTTLSRSDQKLAFEALPPSVAKAVSAGEFDGGNFAWAACIFLAMARSLSNRRKSAGFIMAIPTRLFCKAYFQAPFVFWKRARRWRHFRLI